MAGFAKIAFIGEYFNQAIVNTFHYRSSAWLPLQGNPFDDSLAFLDAFIAHVQTAWMNCFPSDYTLLRAEAIGYDDAYNIVTSSPLVRTINDTGDLSGAATDGAAQAAILSFRLGEQTQISGVVKSKRNRGYICLGPVPSSFIDNYSHITGQWLTDCEDIAELLDDSLTIVAPAVTLVPVRIHTTKAFGLVTGRTYSDVLGYKLPRCATYRRSRQPET